jgi:hypothetical protein
MVTRGASIRRGFCAVKQPAREAARGRATPERGQPLIAARTDPNVSVDDTIVQLRRLRRTHLTCATLQKELTMAPILIPLGLGLVALPIVSTSAFARHAPNLERVQPYRQD